MKKKRLYLPQISSWSPGSISTNAQYRLRLGKRGQSQVHVANGLRCTTQVQEQVGTAEVNGQTKRGHELPVPVKKSTMLDVKRLPGIFSVLSQTPSRRRVKLERFKRRTSFSSKPSFFEKPWFKNLCIKRRFLFCKTLFYGKLRGYGKLRFSERFRPYKKTSIFRENVVFMKK